MIDEPDLKGQTMQILTGEKEISPETCFQRHTGRQTPAWRMS